MKEDLLVLALILASAAARLVLGTLVGLSVDESYAVVMSRRLATSYYDHPPLLFWLPGLAARWAGSEDQFVVRLPFVILFMGTTWLVYRLGSVLFHARAGLWAAVGLNLALFFTLCVGGWVLPDGPLLFWSAAAALALASALVEPTVDEPGSRRRTWLAWAGFGVFSGLALLSKYHAVLLLAGAGLFLATSPRHRAWLRRPEPYLAGALAFLVFTPVIFWNATHDWASLRFQAGRAMPVGAEEYAPLVGTIAGQAGWILPWLWLPLLWVFVDAVRRGPADPRRWLLVCLGAGPLVLFTIVAVFGRPGLPHWPAPGYFMLLPLLGVTVAERLARGDVWTRRWLWGSTAGLALSLAVLVTQSSTGWLTRSAPWSVALGDPTDDLLDWQPVADQLREWGYPRHGVVIAGAIWADAAKLAYALGPQVRVASVGGDPRGFEFVRSEESMVGRDVLLVARRRSGELEPMVAYAPYFARIEHLGTISIDRQGHEGVAVSVYLCERLLRPPPRTQMR